MPHILIRHKVEDYPRWKQIFDEHGAARKACGCKGGTISRSADDPNELVILLEWDDLEGARQFVQSEDLRKTMEKAGVADQPDIYFLEEIERVPV